ncbi:serine--tRNA ligase, partial [Acinetobacter baumannii]|nr:serine--tRNA ligase [Acinetobacter baumannii]
MIDPKLLRNNIEAVNLALATRGVQLNVAEWADLEARRKEIQSKTESLQAERNAGAKQVGQIKKAGGDASEIMARMSAIGDEIKAAEVALSELQLELEAKSLSIPNLPHESVPEGKDENDNVEVLKW